MAAARLEEFGAWLSLVERLVRDQEAGGSNPLAPTIEIIRVQIYPSLPEFPIPWTWVPGVPQFPPQSFVKSSWRTALRIGRDTNTKKRCEGRKHGVHMCRDHDRL